MVVARRTPLAPLSVQSIPSFLHTPSSRPGTAKPNGEESPPTVFASIKPHLIHLVS